MLRDAIIDLSHHNGSPAAWETWGSRVVGIIHKATEGTTVRDPTYAAHRREATARGFWWGAYHFAHPGAVEAQVDAFVEVAGPDADTLLALDWESGRDGRAMTPRDVERFCQRLATVTGRFPLLYCQHSWLGKLATTSLPTEAPLWVARYNTTLGPVTPWTRWTMWQHTDRYVGHYDASHFNGGMTGLRRLWGVEGTDG